MKILFLGGGFGGEEIFVMFDGEFVPEIGLIVEGFEGSGVGAVFVAVFVVGGDGGVGVGFLGKARRVVAAGGVALVTPIGALVALVVMVVTTFFGARAACFHGGIIAGQGCKFNKALYLETPMVFLAARPDAPIIRRVTFY